MLRCAILARVSTQDQDAENQLAQLRQFAHQQGWHIWREYVDCASGGTSNREQFQQMFRDAAQRRFDVLLFWSLDRLSREGVLPTLQHLTRLSDYGVAWRSFSEPYLDSSGTFKDAIVGILATLARQERIRISERTRAGLERARRQGKTLGRPRVEVDVARIRKLRELGLSWTAIAEKMGIARATCQRAVSNGSSLA